MGAWNKLGALKKRLGSAGEVWDRFSPSLYEQLGEALFTRLANSRADRCGQILQRLERLDARPLFLGEAGYPALLSVIAHPPDVLFCRGALPPEGTPAIAVVGSRSNTRYGGAQARRIARELAERGVTVVSGLARGIDAAAHLGALEGGGRTVAVLGCGLGRQYPPENKELAERILARGGAIVSELAPDEMPLAYHFPVRNRIIAGLSDGLLLIEARQKSGTCSTIHYALEQGREVFALPGNVDAPGSELPLTLLKEGAGICTCAEDIIAAMGWPERKGPLPAVPEEEVSEENDPILRALAREEKTLEELLSETGLPVDVLNTQLTLLEINGRIERRAGRAYALAKT